MTPILYDAPPPDFALMSIADLKAESLRLATVLDLANAQRREIFEQIDQRRAHAIAQLRLSRMSIAERDAMKDLLGT